MTNSIVEIGNSVVNQLFHSPVWVFTAIMGLVVGLLVKYIKAIPDRFIPLAVLFVTTVIYGRAGNPADVPYIVANPRVVLGCYGFIEGFVVWFILRQLIIKQLEKRFPSLTPALAQFQTEFVEKKETTIQTQTTTIKTDEKTTPPSNPVPPAGP